MSPSRYELCQQGNYDFMGGFHPRGMLPVRPAKRVPGPCLPFQGGVSEICATIEYDSMTSNEHKKATTEGDVEIVPKSSMAQPLARVHLIDCIKNAMTAAHEKDFDSAMAIVAESVAKINSDRKARVPRLTTF